MSAVYEEISSPIQDPIEEEQYILSDVDEVDTEELAECPVDFHRNFLAHSSGREVNTHDYDYSNIQSSENFETRFINAMEYTLAIIRESSLNHGDLKIVNRKTSAKNLSSFSGDPLDWIRFKEAFEHSIELGNFPIERM